jgi:hypothetical protein
VVRATGAGRRTGGCGGSGGAHILLELVGADRPGLLFVVFTVLNDLRCDIVDASAWTPDGYITALVFMDRWLQLLNRLFVWFLLTASNMPMKCVLKC